MNVDAELEVWRQEWQAVSPVPPQLAEKVARQSRWMKIAIGGDIFVTVTVGGTATGWAAAQPRPEVVVAAAAAWVFLAMAWAIRVVGSRGVWTPAAIDTRSFLDLAIRRAQAALRMLRLSTVLFVCEMTFSLGWVHRESAAAVPFWRWLTVGSPAVYLAWGMTAAFAVGMFWYGRRKRRELAGFLKLRRELD
jgi:hypothetical protein